MNKFDIVDSKDELAANNNGSFRVEEEKGEGSRYQQAKQEEKEGKF